MAQDSPSTESVYDFLYVDTPKLLSYFPQLFNHGVLTEVSHTLNESESLLSELGMKGLAKKSSEETDGQSLGKKYDATHSVPLTVIDRLDELGFISRDLDGAEVGQLVLLEGSIAVTDMGLIQPLWEPIVQLDQDNVLDSFVEKSPGKKKPSNPQKKNKMSSSITQILMGLPHSVLFQLFSGDDQVWATLDRGSLRVSTDDLMFKHGVAIPGVWYALCVVDSEPGVDSSHPKHSDMSSAMAIAVSSSVSHLRQHFGRPDDAYAVTPVMIFRNIQRMSTTEEGSL